MRGVEMSKISEQKEALRARGFGLEDLNNCSDEVVLFINLVVPLAISLKKI